MTQSVVWQKRQKEAVTLHREYEWDVPTIAWFLGIGRSTVDTYLRLAGVPRMTRARRRRYQASLPRTVNGAVARHLGASEIVSGRKFCSVCGRWRLLCDFPRDAHKRHSRPEARCRACGNAARRWYHQHLSESQLANKRERHRIWTKQTRNGKGNGHVHPNVIDEVEWAFLPVAPLQDVLASVPEGRMTWLGDRVGLGEKALRRYMTGESQHVRLDIADNLLVTLGLHLFDVYGDVPVTRNLGHLDSEVRI